MSTLPLSGEMETTDVEARSIVSEITDKRLWQCNVGACVLHSIQGLLMLAASQGIPSVKAFKKDLTTSFLVYDKATRALKSQTKNIGSVEIGVAAAVFLLLSAVAHGLVLLRWQVYLGDLSRGINVTRWYEYALSSSVMICTIAMLFGDYDIGSLILMFFVNASMNLFGLMMERLNPPERKNVDWTPFVFGCVAGVAPWIVVVQYFVGGGNFSEIPGFVYGILFGYFLFFNTFPINMVLQYARVGKWSDYRFGELTYISLSLWSKSLLAWLVFGGTFQPNGN
jgi:hypothetical protein